jgi:hypothetical protein
MMMLWSYGVTTVPSRRHDLLPKTLQSLARAGFPRPRLFVDGAGPADYASLGLPLTCRDGPPLGAWGNWALALYELYVREPVCERYAIFQDDVLAVADLRAYLDACRFPKKGYWNLYTAANAEMAVQDRGVHCGWIEGPPHPNNIDQQCWRGALGLVFDRAAAGIILSSRHGIEKPISTDRPRSNVDGAVGTILLAAGRREWVHGPSLLRHVGAVSTVKEGKVWDPAHGANTWPGEGWSALGVLREPAEVT